MKIALFFFLLCGIGLWSFQIPKDVDSIPNDDKMEESLNLLSKEENFNNSNAFEEKIRKEFQKRRDAVIGTEYWGRKKRNMSRCERWRILKQKLKYLILFLSDLLRSMQRAPGQF
jgi:hypothetical protein